MPPSNTPGRSLGGRFAEATHPLLERINRSVEVDHRLWRQDLAGSRAHSAMLAEVGLITPDERDAIHGGLDAIAAEFEAGTFVFEPADEDVHMAVERRLTTLVGDPARKLHTGRSRNDQVMTDSLLWLRDALAEVRGDLVALVDAFLAQAETGLAQPMPSFTHLQPAQVSSVGQWACHHASELVGHLRRLDDLAARVDADCPLGSGASAGGYLPLDRAHTAAALGFHGPSVNATASTGGRTDLLDAVCLHALIGTTLSRLGEEIVVWASPSFGFVRLPDRLTTGSSLLPQKRNPDGAELLRAGGKQSTADVVALSSALSGLVGGYAKDLQYDKEVLFRSHDRTRDLLQLAALHVEALTWDAARLEAACTPDLAALWLADQLVLAGLPFREGHHHVGAAARHAAEHGVSLADAFAVVAPEHAEIGARLAEQTPHTLMAALQTQGSAGPSSVRGQISMLRRHIV